MLNRSTSAERNEFATSAARGAARTYTIAKIDGLIDFRPSPPVTPSEDYSEFINAGVPSMFFRIGVYEPERVAAAREGEGPQLPSNHSPLFAPVPTIETGVEAMTLAGA